MCFFGGGGAPKAASNPAPYSLEQSHTAVTSTVASASAEDMERLKAMRDTPEQSAETPLRTTNTGIYFKKK